MTPAAPPGEGQLFPLDWFDGAPAPPVEESADRDPPAGAQASDAGEEAPGAGGEEGHIRAADIWAAAAWSADEDARPAGRDEADARAADDGEDLPAAEEDTRTAGRSGAKKGKKGKRRSSRSFWKELPILIVVALVIAVLIKTFLVQAFFIPSGSMNDTLLEGDRVMVNKLAYRLGDPARGDVVVFDSPMSTQVDGESIFGALVRHVAESLGLSSPESVLIKRIIALGGETIEIRESRVYIDGRALDEPYLRDGSWMADYGPFTVPEGRVFVMGDNRSSSSDSRVWGPVDEGEIVGKAFVRVWPPSRWGGL